MDINKQFYSYLLSFILVALSGCLGNVVDGIIVGHLISADGVSAINLSQPIIQFIFTLNLLVNSGTGMLVAYCVGKNDTEQASTLFTRALTLSVGLSVIISIVGGVMYAQPIARTLCDNEHIFPLAYDYMRVLLIGTPAYILLWGLSTMVGADRQPHLVSVAVIVDNMANLLLDIVFIKFFDWGIAGSSAATVAGHLIGIAILLTHWRNHRNLRLTFHTGNVLDSIKRIINQGAPLAVASICLTLLLLSANTIVLDILGRTGIFAFAVCMNLLQVYNLFLVGTCLTLQSLGAIQAGAGDNNALRQVIRKGFRFITVAMAVTCVVVWIDPQVVVSLFGADTAEMINEGSYALRIFALSFVPFCYIYLIMIVYKLYSHHRMALFISFLLSLTVIPVMWLTARYAPQAIWYSYLIAYLIEIVLIAAIHTAGRIKFELKPKPEQ